MKHQPLLLITIDGPAGAGKTTVSKMLARKLRYEYLDTGALYRAVAWVVRKAEIAPEDHQGIGQICELLQLKFEAGRLVANGKDITDRIRSPEITMMASAVSALPVVRKALLDIQRKIGKDLGLVAEGRDIGTVVFPHADQKFFLNATVRQRARRRFAQYGKNGNQTLEEIEADILRRDKNDSSRDIAPLEPADDAVLIDSTEMTPQKVVDFMMSTISNLGIVC